MTAEPPRPQLPPLKIATNPSHRNSGDPFGEMGTCELRASLMQINSIPCEKNISLSTTRRFKPVSTAISRMKPLPKRVIKSLTFNRCVNATPSFGGYFMNLVCLTLLKTSSVPIFNSSTTTCCTSLRGMVDQYSGIRTIRYGNVCRPAT